MKDDDPLSFRFRARARHTRRVLGATARAGLRRLARRSPLDDLAFGEALVAELDAMKGMAMKIGQILSYMDGALPEETSAALAALQRGAKPAPREHIEAVLVEELGAPVAESFERFDWTPIAAASIGQVHRASLGGQQVAVKVQYPGVQETFEADMSQLHRIARIASLATHVDGAAIVEELRARVLEECDYSREADNIGRFEQILQGMPGIALPGVIRSHSTRRVLTTRWMPGTSLERFLEQTLPHERTQAALALVRFAWVPLWQHGVLHADPHPGNQLYAIDQVGFLDFGCVRSFEPAWLATESAVIEALLAHDRGAFRSACLATGQIAVERGFDWDTHWGMLHHLWEPYLTPTFRFTPDYLQRGVQFSRPSNPNLRKLSIPPEWIWLQRVTWGLHSVLTRMRAEAPLGGVLRAALEARAPEARA